MPRIQRVLFAISLADAAIPMHATPAKKCPLQRPMSMCFSRVSVPRRRAASSGLRGMPSARTRSFPRPPDSGATIAPDSYAPSRARARTPSPASTATIWSRSHPRRMSVACWAESVRCTVTSQPPASSARRISGARVSVRPPLAAGLTTRRRLGIEIPGVEGRERCSAGPDGGPTR